MLGGKTKSALLYRLLARKTLYEVAIEVGLMCTNTVGGVGVVVVCAGNAPNY